MLISLILIIWGSLIILNFIVNNIYKIILIIESIVFYIFYVYLQNYCYSIFLIIFFFSSSVILLFLLLFLSLLMSSYVKI